MTATETLPVPPPPPAPTIDTDSAGFWAAAREGRVALCHCQECGHWMQRPLERCNRCGGPTGFDDVAGTGTIYSFIVVHHPGVPTFAGEIPYVIAIVEFDEGPRLPGILIGEKGPGVAVGQPARAELVQVPGAEEKALMFRRDPAT
ncbi:MAG: OB-fold domain-containing protein [Ilumatobacteraceae bacterium]